MPTQITAEDGRQSLNAHVAAKGAELHARYGPRLGWNELQRLLEDRSCVRYPCIVAFEYVPLRPGEFAHPVPQGERPEDGFIMYVHPYYLMQPDKIPYLVLYQLVLVNYGEFATSDDAEIFAAGALGLSREEYYATLCELADELSPEGNSFRFTEAREGSKA
jgi:hypothetical protein